MKSLTSTLTVTLLLAATGTHAQTMYKSTMPDGRVVYGEKPVPGAKRVDAITPPAAKPGVTIVTPAEKAGVAKGTADKRAAQERELDEARRQLQEAEAARETGKEPLPGERIGTAGGMSRLTDAYWERQKKLEQAVETARARLDKAEQAVR